MKRWFVAGTDTGIGKTHAACALIRHLAIQGRLVAAMKPVASGCQVTADGLRNEDAVAMMETMNVDLEYAQVNPFAYEPAIAPHIAAEEAGYPVNINQIAEIADAINADHLVIEGAGGWCVPLGDQTMFPELVRMLEADVILVVGMKLGCINHALLTAHQIIRDGCTLSGWIANRVDPEMPVYPENLQTLLKLMPVPLIAEIAWQSMNLSFADKIWLNHDNSDNCY